MTDALDMNEARSVSSGTSFVGEEAYKFYGRENNAPEDSQGASNSQSGKQFSSGENVLIDASSPGNNNTAPSSDAAGKAQDINAAENFTISNPMFLAGNNNNSSNNNSATHSSQDNRSHLSDLEQLEQLAGISTTSGSRLGGILSDLLQSEYKGDSGGIIASQRGDVSMASMGYTAALDDVGRGHSDEEYGNRKGSPGTRKRPQTSAVNSRRKLSMKSSLSPRYNLPHVPEKPDSFHTKGEELYWHHLEKQRRIAEKRVEQERQKALAEEAEKQEHAAQLRKHFRQGATEDRKRMGFLEAQARWSRQRTRNLELSRQNSATKVAEDCKPLTYTNRVSDKIIAARGRGARPRDVERFSKMASGNNILEAVVKDEQRSPQHPDKEREREKDGERDTYAGPVKAWGEHFVQYLKVKQGAADTAKDENLTLTPHINEYSASLRYNEDVGDRLYRQGREIETRRREREREERERRETVDMKTGRPLFKPAINPLPPSARSDGGSESATSPLSTPRHLSQSTPSKHPSDPSIIYSHTSMDPEYTFTPSINSRSKVLADRHKERVQRRKEEEIIAARKESETRVGKSRPLSAGFLARSQNFLRRKEAKINSERAIKSQQEVEGCTFKPKLNKTRRETGSRYLEHMEEEIGDTPASSSAIYHRNLQWEKEREKHLSVQRSRKEDAEMKECVFTPRTYQSRTRDTPHRPTGSPRNNFSKSSVEKGSSYTELLRARSTDFAGHTGSTGHTGRNVSNVVGGTGSVAVEAEDSDFIDRFLRAQQRQLREGEMGSVVGSLGEMRLDDLYEQTLMSPTVSSAQKQRFARSVSPLGKRRAGSAQKSPLRVEREEEEVVYREEVPGEVEELEVHETPQPLSFSTVTNPTSTSPSKSLSLSPPKSPPKPALALSLPQTSHSPPQTSLSPPQTSLSPEETSQPSALIGRGKSVDDYVDSVVANLQERIRRRSETGTVTSGEDVGDKREGGESATRGDESSTSPSRRRSLDAMSADLRDLENDVQALLKGWQEKER